jgi:uncharacterized repeat protein (TIGR01451 family)
VRRIDENEARIAASLAFFLTLLGVPFCAHADTYSIVADKDSWLKQSSSSENHGDDSKLSLKSKSNDSMRVVMHFDLQEIPPGAVVTNATLRLSVDERDDSGQPVRVHHITTSWAENGVTWLNRANSYAPAVVHGSFTPAATGPISADVTGLVRSWLSGTLPNHGLMLIATSLDEESKYNSLEDSNVADRPVLVIRTADQADLEIGVTISHPVPHEGDTITFVASLRNHGPNLATGVTVSNPLPGGATYQTGTASQGSYDPGTGVWVVGPLASGSAASLAITVMTNPGTTGTSVTNTASVTALDQFDPDSSNNTASRSVIISAPASTTLNASAYSQASDVLRPGAVFTEVIRVKLANHSAVPETLLAFEIRNRSSGPGTTAQLDAEWSPLQLWVDPAGPSPPALGGMAGFSGGVAVFTNLVTVIPANDSVDLVARGGASLQARDSDALDLEVSSPVSFTLASAAAPSGTWPLDPPGSFPVDGMVAGQINVDPAEPRSILSGSQRNLVMGFRVPANGYQSDVIDRLDVVNQGTAAPGADITRLETWVDDGNGVFEPEMDRLLGEMLFTGGRWQRTALSEPVHAPGLHIFVTADVAELATEGTTLHLVLPSLPDLALGMASANDGPKDAAVENGAEQIISAADRVSFTAIPIQSRTTTPRERDVLMLDLLATNLYGVPKTLTSLQVSNLTTGPGSTAERDRELEPLFLRVDGNGDGQLGSEAVDPVIGASSFAGGRASFTGLAWTLAPGASANLFVTGQTALRAADGDVLGVQVSEVSSLGFADATGVAANWPLDSGARHTVDGMVAAQIANASAPVTTLGPSEGPVLALDLVVPSNGYAADVLRGIRLRNLGTATPSDLADLHLWRDGGDGAFDAGAGDDASLGALSFLVDRWVSPVLSVPLSGNGARLFTSVTSSNTPTDSAWVRLALELDGLTVDSGNDGPRDVDVANANPLFLSTSTLLAAPQLAPSASTLGQTVTATFLVRNVGPASVTGITPTALQHEGGGTLAVLVGPSPDSLTLPPGGQGTFTWSLRADSIGDVRLRAGVQGIESGTGVQRRSLQAPSNTHQIFLEAEDLGLYSVNSMPFSVNRGQNGVVPLNLTFSHPGGAGASGVRLRNLRVRLEDAAGVGIVPADLVSRVVVSEGSRVYLTKTALETAGAEVALPLAQAVEIEAGGNGGNQVTLSLSLDISDTTAVPSFRVVIGDSTWFTAENAVSGAPVAARLQGASYPVRSGVTRVLAEARELDVRALGAAPREVGQGQTAVTLIPLELLNPDSSGLAADVRLSAFRVSLLDSAGQLIADPWRRLKTIRVRGAFQQFLNRAVTAADDTTLALFLSPLVSAPANTTLPLWIEADVADSATLGGFRLRVAEESWFDARDANTGAPVTVYYPAPPLEGPLLTVRSPAESLSVRRLSGIAPTVTVGQSGVDALRFTLTHAGQPQMGRIVVDTLAIECHDEMQNPLRAADFVFAARVYRGGSLVGQLVSPPSTGSVLRLTLAGVALLPGTTDTLQVVVDVAPTAPASFLELRLDRLGIAARDENLSEPVAVAPEGGATLPLSSGITRLLPPARMLVAGLASMMPAALAADGRTVAAGRLTLANVAAPASGAIRVSGLRVRAADRDGREIPLGAAAASLTALVADTSWAHAGALSVGDTAAMLLATDTLDVQPGIPAVIELRFVTRPETDLASLRIGCDGTDIRVVQPASALLAVAVQADSGQTFPLWTEAGSFGALDLAASYSNFPNPFAAGREATSFAYYLNQGGRVWLRVYTLAGEPVRTLANGEARAAGVHQVDQWDGKNGAGHTVRNGVYVAELRVQYDAGSSERALRKIAVRR